MRKSNNRMKVLFLRSNYGQPDSRCEKEISCLSKKYDIELLGWNRELSYSGIRDTEIKINEKPFTFHHIGIKAPLGKGFKKLFFPLLKYWFSEIRYLRKHVCDYDVIHACDFDAGFPVLLSSHKSIIVYDVFDYYADSHSGPHFILKLIRKLENKIIRKSNAVIICSESRKKQILPESPEKLAIIHNSPPQSIIGSYSDSKYFDIKQSNKIKIAYAGMLSTDRMLKEIAEVVMSRPDVELYIGGMGILSDYFQKISKNCDNIKYYGKVQYKEAIEIEELCDIMTAIYDPSIPNHKYAAPNKFYEALMLKKPLIMMRDTGMDSYVEKYQLGEVIDGSAETFKEGFSRALDNLIAKKEQWAEMGECGYKLYQEQFSWNEMEKRLLNLYDDLESTYKYK